MIKKLPSFIDMHTHLREPGYTDKETIETGLLSAKFGGYGAVLAMPNTNPVCDNIETVQFILEKSKMYDVELYPVGAITCGLKSDKLTDFNMLKKAGCIAFSNDGFSTKCAKEALMTGELILSHLEDETKEANEQIKIFEELVNNGFSPKLHFCHISKKETIDLIRNAKKKGLKITAETCPHYFIFTKDNIDETGRFKMNPPLASEIDRDSVIEAIIDGTIDVISTDHAPHTNEEKLSPYNISPNGITGLETCFSLSFMSFGLDLTLEKMAYAPRRILGIDPKTKIEVDLDCDWIAKGENFKSKCKITPYENMKLKGKILC